LISGETDWGPATELGIGTEKLRGGKGESLSKQEDKKRGILSNKGPSREMATAYS